MSNNTNLSRTITTGTIALSAVFSLTACGSYDAPGELGENQQILTSCPADEKLNTFVQWDGTASNSSPEVDEQRLRTVRALAQRTAVCEGHLTVSVFSTSSGSTVTVYDGEFNLPGATDNARLRRVPEAVEAVDVAVRNRYARSIASLPTGGTDINGIYRLAGEQQAQLGDGYRLVFVILTDGMNNLGGITLDGEALTPEEGSALADQVSVPHLPGAEITVAGLGRIAEGSAPSNLVAGLVAYYDRLCARTGAATCTSVTDWR